MTSKSKFAQPSPEVAASPTLFDRLKIHFRQYICPFDLLLSHIPPNARYFDIGCGSGMFLKRLAERKSPVALGGVEVSERLIKNAARLLESFQAPLSLTVYDGRDFPAEIDGYDYLFLIDVLHHLPRGTHTNFLTNLHNRMRPGQRLFLKDIDAASRLVYWNKLHDLLLSGQFGSECSASDIRRLLQSIGFQIDVHFTKRVMLYPHYFLLCTKL